jgi:protocatechuate 3,4-dioxygenase beta subunit
MQLNRRDVLRHLTIGAMALQTIPGLFAQVLTETARMGEGPFYPDKLPLDTDNDLLVITNSITPAVGEITHVSGRLLSDSGEPVRNALIEIWQVDNRGSYIHKDGENTGGRDSHFQGYGRFLTDSRGQYYFRTIKPVAYTLQGQFRAPHIHFIVGRNGRRVLTTQMMVKGHEANSRDFVLAAAKDPSSLDTILVDFKAMAGSTIGELTANFDIVLGRSPQVP